MTTLTLETRNASGKLETMTFEILKEGKFGFDVKLPKGKKSYVAIRNRHNLNFVTVLRGNGQHVFQGVII